MKYINLWALSLCVLGSLNIAYANSYWSSPQTTQTNTSLKSNSSSELNYDLDMVQLKADLASLSDSPDFILPLPRTDGSISSFKIQETYLLPTELAYKYPELKTYKIEHVSDPSVRGRLEVLNNTFSAMIKTPKGQELIRSAATSFNQQRYSVKNRGAPTEQFSCGTSMTAGNKSFSMKLPDNHQYQNRASVNNLTELRIAIATTEEYSSQFGNDRGDVFAEIMLAVNRINEIFESELAVTFTFANDSDDLIFLSGSGDPYDNSDVLDMLEVNSSVINNIIPSSSYDIGHVFSTSGGGVATLESVCTSFKARGVSGHPNPTGDPFWVDIVAHEIGHQLGALHTFNGTTSSCGFDNRSASSAYEPGSGSTIMAYAGICSAENLQNFSDASFHLQSIAQMDSVLSSLPSCGTQVAYGAPSHNSGETNLNSPIISTVPSNLTIPVNTPFAIAVSASDADGDTLLYQWDGNEVGSSTSSSTLGCDLGDNALFRSNLPVVGSTRYFPSMESLLNGVAYRGETLPTTDRSVNFTVKVTDEKGGLASAQTILTADTDFDEFKVTSQSSSGISFTAGDPVTVTWDVANTTSAPVSCATVDIQLLSFSSDKSTFSMQSLSSGEANDGVATVNLPASENSAISRFLVQCESNVFFAINSQDFSISGGTVSASNTDHSSSGGVEVSSSFAVPSNLSCSSGSSGDSGDEQTESLFSEGRGSLSFGSLAFLVGLLLLARRRL